MMLCVCMMHACGVATAAAAYNMRQLALTAQPMLLCILLWLLLIFVSSIHVQGMARFEFPVHAFWGTDDHRITVSMVSQWEKLTDGDIKVTQIHGKS